MRVNARRVGVLPATVAEVLAAALARAAWVRSRSATAEIGVDFLRLSSLSHGCDHEHRVHSFQRYVARTGECRPMMLLCLVKH